MHALTPDLPEMPFRLGVIPVVDGDTAQMHQGRHQTDSVILALAASSGPVEMDLARASSPLVSIKWENAFTPCTRA